jgi:PKHD-type hydroxylase
VNGEWCYFKSYLNKETCNKILNLSQSIHSRDAVVGIHEASRVNQNTRRSKIKFLEKGDDTFKFLFDTLWLTAIQANNDFFNIHITKLDYVQLAEYSSEYKGEYKDHHDVFWINKDPIYHRKLSCIIQLTDPNEYEGGEFELIDTNQFPNADDIKQQGTIIYFPSLFLHRAKPVTKGIRHSIAAWFDGPKWR